MLLGSLHRLCNPQSVNPARSEDCSTHHTLTHNSFNEGKDTPPPPKPEPLACIRPVSFCAAAFELRHPPLHGLIYVTTTLSDCFSFLCFSPRMDDPFCLSALRSPFYSLPAGGALPPIHPSAVHMHLPGVRYPGDFTHPSLSALQSAER